MLFFIANIGTCCQVSCDLCCGSGRSNHRNDRRDRRGRRGYRGMRDRRDRRDERDECFCIYTGPRHSSRGAKGSCLCDLCSSVFNCCTCCLNHPKNIS